MGKPYQSELDLLKLTYAWSQDHSVQPLASFLRATASRPLITIGSGGSFSSANFVASAHQRYAGQLAIPVTPLDATTTELDFRSIGAVLLSAGGKNPDVLGTLQHLVEREPLKLLVFCTSLGTPLLRQASKYKFIDCVEIETPAGKDGFLATNSLLATTVLFLRAYGEAFRAELDLPDRFDDLVYPFMTRSQLADGENSDDELWTRETIVLLHGPSTRSAAIDLESKFTEAALGNVQIADYRNFGHGRHHWLAKRGGSTGVIAFLSADDEATGSATIRLLPKNIPVRRIRTPFVGSVANLAILAQSFYLVNEAGRVKGIDPGRPGVPAFGRKIYHLKAAEYVHAQSKLSSANAAISRKIAASRLTGVERLAFWRDAYDAFTKRLVDARFRGLILDYDGTLCDLESRFHGLKDDLGKELVRVLRAGVLVGIATGRGQSVRNDLRKHVPEEYWPRVIVGYYNGGDLGTLAEDDHPNGEKRVRPAMMPIAVALRTDVLLTDLVECECRLPQIQVTPRNPEQAETAWKLLQQVVQRAAIPGVSVLRSSHSMDVLAPGVSKQAVVNHIAAILKENSPILCIGDRGQWPGNDFSLLAGPHSLSVDEVSCDSLSCWNLALPGHRGPQATLTYLRSLRANRMGARLTLPLDKGKRK